MPVDIRMGESDSTPLHATSSRVGRDEADTLRLVKRLVETKHADKGLRENEGHTAADRASQIGSEKVAAYLTNSEREAKAKMAEEELLSMLDAEEYALKNKKRKKKNKKQQQDKGRYTMGSGEGKSAQGEEMEKGSGAHLPDSQVVVRQRVDRGRGIKGNTNSRPSQESPAPRPLA